MSRALVRITAAVFAASLVLLASQPAFAKTVELYDSQGRQVRDYNRLIASVRVGDTVVLGPNPDERIVVAKTLSNAGKNNVTKIWLDAKTGDVIRVPRGRGVFRGTTYLDWFNGYIGAFKRLADLAPEDRLPRTIKAVEGRYIRQAKYTKYFDLKQFLYSRHIDPDVREAARVDLHRLARDLAMVGKAGDVHLEQFVFTDHGWILTDAHTPVVRAALSRKTSIFQDLGLNEEDTKFLQALIVEERRAICVEAGLAEEMGIAPPPK